MPNLALKIPPVVIVVLTLLLMWLTGRWLPITKIAFPGQQITYVVLCVIGVALFIAAAFEFGRHKTTVNPTDPEQASALITSGVFKFTRNPIYLAFAFILLGWGIRLASVTTVLFVPAFMLYMTYFQIKPEEQILLKKFGTPFADYMQRVRRWL